MRGFVGSITRSDAPVLSSTNSTFFVAVRGVAADRRLPHALEDHVRIGFGDRDRP
jgi:hypothetical protein